MSRIIFKFIALALFVNNIMLMAQIDKMEPDEEEVYYPLTATKLPKYAYRKDTNNELSAFEGTWKGHWEDKTVIIKFKKQIRFYDNTMDIYLDNLIAKFQVKDVNGNIIFDNLDIADNEAKIEGRRMLSSKNSKYSLIYTNNDLCGIGGFVDISFTDTTKTKLKLFYMTHSILITGNCPYLELPEPFPVREDFILTKQ